MNAEYDKRAVDRIHKTNTQRVSYLLNRDLDLNNLSTVLDSDVAAIYQRLIPRHAELCEINQERKLDDSERAELAVSYASLYPTFGDEGIILLAATWIATRPNRQARYS
ncbi:MAG: hypothetical protein V1917_01005 [Candidatus Gottesmanbacteria bacterium]